MIILIILVYQTVITKVVLLIFKLFTISQAI